MTHQTLLRKKVDDYFTFNSLSRTADSRLLIKFFFLLAVLLISYTAILLGSSAAGLFVSYIIFGLSSTLLAVNIGHESVHGVLSKNPKLNKAGIYTFFLAGISGPLWKRKHVGGHHRFTNVPDLDPDLQQSFLIRLDKGYPKSRWHSYQHIYIYFLYLLYTLHWTLVKDFRESLTATDTGRKFAAEGFLITALIKIVYLLIALVIPYYVRGFDNLVIGAFLLNYIATGAFFAIFLIPIHINDYAMINHEDNLSHTSVAAQLRATPNYSTHNRILNFLLGGFNHHACHHLFPDISHVHYPALTKLIQETCADVNLKCIEVSLASLLKSHYRYLKQLSV